MYSKNFICQGLNDQGVFKRPTYINKFNLPDFFQQVHRRVAVY